MDNVVIQADIVSKIFNINKQQNVFSFLKKHTETKSKEKILALDKVSFTVNRGEILGIIGLNGCGKTTLLRLIAGIYKPNSGSITVNGRLSPLLQLETGFHGDLNARENIIMNGMLLGIPKSEIEKKIDSIIQFAELEKFTNLKLKHFSSGMRTRLAFSTAMQIDPDILLIDEIFSVGDRIFAEKSYNSLLSFKKAKKTIVLATHNIGKLAEFADKVLLLHEGRVVMIGEPEEVIKKYGEINSSNLL